MSLLKGDFVYRSPEPLLIEETKACRLRSAERYYIDCQASSGAAILGYDSSLLAGLEKISGPLSKPQTVESHLRINYASRLSSLIASAIGRKGSIAFEMGGAQAIELAIKVALSRSRNITLMSLEGAYHGRSIFASHLSASRRYTLGTSPAKSILRLPNPNMMAEDEKISLGDATDFCIRWVEKAFTDERKGLSDPSGWTPVFVYEAIQNVSGMLDIPSKYLQRIEELVRAQNGICIIDEIFTGMYRMGPLFYHVTKALRPDIVVFSKGLTNGIVPLSAIWVSDDSSLADDFVPGTHSCTYLNGELALIIADRVLDRLESLDLQKASSIGAKLECFIRSQFDSSPFIRHFSKGSVLKLDLDSHEDAKALSNRLLHKAPVGVLHATTGLAKKSLIFHPPLVISEDELKSAAEIVAAESSVIQ